MTESEVLTKETEAVFPEGDGAEAAEAALAPRLDEAKDAPENDARGALDYDELIAKDVAELKASFPELADLGDITELDDPLRYGALRDLGLTPEEAYRATARRTRRSDNRAHLKSSAPRHAAAPNGSLPYAELQAARELLGVSDAELQRLYKRVTR